MKTYWDKLSQLNTRFPENSSGITVHAIPLAIYHLTDPNLYNFNTASQTRARITVEDCRAIPKSLPTRFQECVFLSVDTKTGRQSMSRPLTLVAPSASALAAVAEPTWGSVVSRAHYTLVADHHAANPALHAVGALRGQ